MKIHSRILFYLFPFLLPLIAGAVQKSSVYDIGIARTDVTPAYKVRLGGYREREFTHESDGAAQHIYARAMAFSDKSTEDSLSVLICVDAIGMPAHIREEVANRLRIANGMSPDHVSICATHSHAAPSLIGAMKTIFSDLGKDAQNHIEQYTKDLADSLVAVALKAFKNEEPSQLYWSQGSAHFARNRSAGGGPVDNDLPMLVVRDLKGKLRAIYCSYACHGTSLMASYNSIHGDWPGAAEETLEKDYPGVVAMISIGCGADADPIYRGSLADAQKNAAQIVSGIKTLLDSTLTPINGKLQCRSKQIMVAIDKPPTKEELNAECMNGVFWACYNLARVANGTLPKEIPYYIETWNFGNDLALVFLPGEVVADYSLRLKNEFPGKRLWVNAYSNDIPCYIPSERTLKKGGYEAGGAMVYYGWPSCISPGVEDNIIGTVHELLPGNFTVNSKEPVNHKKL